MENAKVYYCITHELEYFEDGYHMFWCNGPYATCAPSEMSEEMWEATFASEPSDEELAQMDENAETLMLD